MNALIKQNNPHADIALTIPDLSSLEYDSWAAQIASADEVAYFKRQANTLRDALELGVNAAEQAGFDVSLNDLIVDKALFLDGMTRGNLAYLLHELGMKQFDLKNKMMIEHMKAENADARDRINAICALLDTTSK